MSANPSPVRVPQSLKGSIRDERVNRSSKSQSANSDKDKAIFTKTIKLGE